MTSAVIASVRLSNEINFETIVQIEICGKNLFNPYLFYFSCLSTEIDDVTN